MSSILDPCPWCPLWHHSMSCIFKFTASVVKLKPFIMRLTTHKHKTSYFSKTKRYDQSRQTYLSFSFHCVDRNQNNYITPLSSSNKVYTAPCLFTHCQMYTYQLAFEINAYFSTLRNLIYPMHLERLHSKSICNPKIAPTKLLRHITAQIFKFTHPSNS